MLLLARLTVLALLVQVVVSAEIEGDVAALPSLESIPALVRFRLMVGETIGVEISTAEALSLVGEAALLLEVRLVEATLSVTALVFGILSTESSLSSALLTALLTALIGWMIKVAISTLQFPAIGTVPANGSIASALHEYQLILNEICS